MKKPGFSERSLTHESANGVKLLLDTTNSCLKALSNIEVKVSDWDVIINHLDLAKLNQESRRLWEVQICQLESEKLPPWNHVAIFLESRFRALEMIDTGKNVIRSPIVATSNKVINKNRIMQQSQKKKSCESIDEAKEIYDQMVKLKSVGGFILQKWNTNSQVLLEYIEEESKGSEALVFKTNNDMIKMLGIRWNRTTDCCEYVLKLSNLPESMTKRHVLSKIARLYDPLG
ncbi:unnamed protein product [Parnassius mnemosyne]|uniref:Uncharacterized protein n=1 Tax=Parnassius mnemosyne TaxID=213953 RepID=A0AAV1L5I6_9NEOP